MSFRSDSELVEACLRGETAAWDALVHRYTRLVWSTCRGENVPHADCEDLHQNVFASLVTRLESIRDRERLSSWLITAARRECWRWKRRRTIAAGRMAPDGDPDDVALREVIRRPNGGSSCARAWSGSTNGAAPCWSPCSRVPATRVMSTSAGR